MWLYGPQTSSFMLFGNLLGMQILRFTYRSDSVYQQDVQGDEALLSRTELPSRYVRTLVGGDDFQVCSGNQPSALLSLRGSRERSGGWSPC